MADIKRFKGRRKPLPAPEVVTTIYGDGIEPLTEFTKIKFSLSKRSGRTAIQIHAGNKSWCLSEATGVFPKTFAEARVYVQGVALGHGHEPFEELKRARRSSRPKDPLPWEKYPEDWKLKREGGCKREWINHPDPCIQVEAIIRCQHPALYCAADGYCHYGNCDLDSGGGSF